MTPKLSVILATDYYATIKSVVQCMRRQTIRESIELILVGRSEQDLSPALQYSDDFLAIRIVEDPVEDLSTGRAAGVRAAQAPHIFIGETHSYPHPNLGEAALAVFECEPCTVVVPCIANANPVSPLSSSGVILDYGTWFRGLSGGPIDMAPIYNAVYDKSVLLELGDRLTPALAQADDLWRKLRDEGRLIVFEPCAQIDHVNVTMPWHWALNRFYCGVMIAGTRSSDWSVGKRIVYIGGSFLIPIVLLRRIGPGVAAGLQDERRKLRTRAAIFAGLVLRACGEVFGYAGMLRRKALDAMFQYEVHKLKYAARELR
jgi:hypothetical protein